MKTKFLKAISWAVFPALLVGGFAIASSGEEVTAGSGKDTVSVCGSHGDQAPFVAHPGDIRSEPRDAVDVPLEAVPARFRDHNAEDVVAISAGPLPPGFRHPPTKVVDEMPAGAVIAQGHSDSDRVKMVAEPLENCGR